MASFNSFEVAREKLLMGSALLVDALRREHGVTEPEAISIVSVMLQGYEVFIDKWEKGRRMPQAADDKQNELVTALLDANSGLSDKQSAVEKAQERLRTHWRAMNLNLEDINGLLGIVAKGYAITIKKIG